MAWANGYEARGVFTFNVHPASNLTAFPNLILGTYPQLADVAHGGYVSNVVTLLGQIVPADLIFTSDAAGTALLNWEIESWNNTTGAIVAWVNSDRLAASDTLVYAWVGKSSVTTYQCTASATWDSNYKGVWHLPNGVSLSVLDSTTHNTVTNYGATATNGQVDGAARFVKASSQYMTSPNPAGGRDLTFSVWMNGPTSSDDEVMLDSRTNGGGGGNYSGVVIYRNSNNYGVWWVGGGVSQSNSVNINDGNWHHYVGTLKSAGSIQSLYIDGVQSASASTSYTTLNEPTLQIGRTSDIVPPPPYLDGALDEIRISNVARSADWIAHEYRQQAQATAWYTAAWGYQDVLSISSTAGTSVTASAAMAALLSMAATVGESITAAATQSATVAVGSTVGASATVVSSIAALVSASVSAGVSVTAQGVMSMLLSVAATVQASAVALAQLAAAVSVGAQAGIVAAAQAAMVSAIVAGAELGISASAAMVAQVTLAIPVASGVFLVMIFPPMPGYAASANVRLCFITTEDARLDMATATDAG